MKTPPLRRSGPFSPAWIAVLTLAAVVSGTALSRPIPPAGPADQPFGPAADISDTLRPLRVDSMPVIDGVFDEPFWRNAPSLTGFRTFIPDFDIVPEEQTVVALAYDAENLYFGFRCYDDVTKIKSSLAARDRMITDDFICINLDPFNDQQGLNAFYVNPQGMQGDSRFSAGNEDFSPDFVWYSAGRIDSVGYTVEVQLPLKSLRYRHDEPTVMGVILERYISRRQEHSCVPRLDPARGFAILTQMQPVAYRGIEKYTLFEVLPAVTAFRREARHATLMEREEQDGELSLTAKYGLTSDLILDGTVNPDFSQVESDAGQVDVNLRYSLFYPEKRPFFLEGQDNFTVAATGNDLDPQIFYSRTIADPLVGTKLTGKAGARNTLALLYAADNVLEPDRDRLGRYAHVPVVRYKRALDDDSYLGFLYAGRELDATNNRVAGFDQMVRVSEASMLSGSGFLSTAKDDPGKESVDGHTLGLSYAYGTRDLDYRLSVREVSENFRADMGYITRTGLVNIRGFLNPRIYPETDFIQQIGLELISRQTKDRPSGMWETLNDAAVTMYFAGSWIFRVRANYSTEIYDARRFRTSGVHTQLRSQITNELYFNVVQRYIRSIYYPTPEQGKSNVLGVAVTYQPSESFRTDVNFTYSDFTSDASGARLYDYMISRLKFTYQVNQYLFFRAIGEYNDYRKDLSTEFLASFTYIPGTVVYLGFGSLYEKVRWDGTGYIESDGLLEMRRGLFLKMSYLWRS